MTREYFGELNKAIEEDRIKSGKKPIKEREEVKETKEIRVSKTDSECGFMSRQNKQEMFCYLNHRATDMKFNIITDVYVTPGNVPTTGLFPKWKFTYDKERDLYIYPINQELTYRTTTREGYREYKSDSKKCENCPLLSQCTRSKNKVKVVTRHVWEEHKEKVRLNRLTKSGKIPYKF